MHGIDFRMKVTAHEVVEACGYSHKQTGMIHSQAYKWGIKFLHSWE
jgi:hypothetical protein